MKTARKYHTDDGTWTLTLDKEECYEGGTPALVTSPKGNTGTYYCCMDQGVADCDEIPPSVMKWLGSHGELVKEFLETWRRP